MLAKVMLRQNSGVVPRMKLGDVGVMRKAVLVTE